jgi:hypothetical protein
MPYTSINFMVAMYQNAPSGSRIGKIGSARIGSSACENHIEAAPVRQLQNELARQLAGQHAQRVHRGTRDPAARHVADCRVIGRPARRCPESTINAPVRLYSRARITVGQLNSSTQVMSASAG